MTTKSVPSLSSDIQFFLEEHKIFDIVSVSLTGKSAIAEMFIIASGRSQKHISTIAELLRDHLKKQNLKFLYVEGLPSSDWILVDAGDIIVHLFKPEVRDIYNLEKIWSY